MLNIQQHQGKNPYEAFFNKEITLEEFAFLIGVEPHLVILHLKELIADYENKFNFVPSLALYNIAADLYHEYSRIETEAEEYHDRVNLKISIADSLRKTAKTLDELKRVRQSSTVIVQNNIAQINNVAIEQFLNKVTPYLCPKCQEKILDKYDEIITK